VCGGGGKQRLVTRQQKMQPKQEVSKQASKQTSTIPYSCTGIFVWLLVCFLGSLVCCLLHPHDDILATTTTTITTPATILTTVIPLLFGVWFLYYGTSINS
jgi:hypothetical protein